MQTDPRAVSRCLLLGQHLQLDTYGSFRIRCGRIDENYGSFLTKSVYQAHRHYASSPFDTMCHTHAT